MERSRHLFGLASGSNAAVEADDEVAPAAVGDIVAAIRLVAGGLAVRVSLSGFGLPADLAREADEISREWGCRAMVAIEAGGSLGLVIEGAGVEGG